jgi:hypothetical protein
MPKPFIAALCIPVLFLLTSCSPRDFLTRRLAADLIERASTFRAPQQLRLRTGVISNVDYLAPDYIRLQHRGWISGVNKSCLQDISPPPCWEVTLTPAGVDAFQSLVSPSDAEKQSFNIPAARRELIAVTGISKVNNSAQVEFTWKWTPLNEVGAALYPGDQHYRSVASFRSYDDGWRLVQGTPHPVQSFDDALKNAEPAQ